MNFTRDAIILSVITPKEGYKLLIRNSKNSEREEHFLDFVEVVTFGSATFFRSLERPKVFLLPIEDYEIFEVKENRMVLKNASYEKSSKNGKKEVSKRKGRKRKIIKEEGGGTIDEVKTSSSVRKGVLSPPPTLIKEKLKRIKDEEFFEENILPEKVDADKIELEKKEIESENVQTEQKNSEEDSSEKE